jgi:N6-L-threonylcarbamoyladenine synthase
MKILGIESSCDETAAAVVEDGRRLLSNVVNSQIDIHAVYGGVVPEVAARSHIEVINPVINQALSDAKLTWDDIDGIAVTYAPGLIGSLLVGTLAARTLAVLKNKPLYPIHHVEAHVYANFLNEKEPEFPLLALIVSGGHSQLAIFKGHGDYQLLGQTCDDAIGEVFDKVAKILGLPYPGGPSIDRAAENGNPDAYKLPKAVLKCHHEGEHTGMLNSEDGICHYYDFSFSGLKTAVLRAVQREVGVDITFPSTGLAERLDDAQRNDFAASFQKVAIETLVDKTELAFNKFNPKTVVIAGGVASSSRLRQVLSERLHIDIDYAPRSLCTDNAAMVATLGCYYARTMPSADPYTLEVKPSVSMTQTAWNLTNA